MVKNEISIRDHIFEPYISREQLNDAITNIADKINLEYKDTNTLPVFLVTLTGAIFFATELLKKLDFCPKIGFVKCSSYADGMVSSGKVNVKIEPTVDISNKEVIVLEDIVDTGITWDFLNDYLFKLGAKTVRIATMLLKDVPVNNPVPIDWYGLKVENKFLVGMGLDYGELGRNLPTIYKLKD